LVLSSPIPSHPDTRIIDETIARVRYHLPDSRIIILQDGIRPEQLDHEATYNIYFRKLAIQAVNGQYGDVKLWPFAEYTHQAGMMMRAIEDVSTPLILFQEHDVPIMERPIDWEMLCDVVNRGVTNCVRLHYDEQIHADHQHLMHGKLTDNLIKTTQFHARPHLALTHWYEQLLGNNFTTKSRCFVEDVAYSPISWSDWSAYRCCVYDPNGDGKLMKRSYDLNGRGGEPKYDQIFR
jgi:hypothetical protein